MQLLDSAQPVDCRQADCRDLAMAAVLITPDGQPASVVEINASVNASLTATADR
jgi:hypothetical protein